MINIKTDYQNHQYVLQYKILGKTKKEYLSFFDASCDVMEKMCLDIKQKVRDSNIKNILK